ncbi:hypothetical protein [Pontibacter russatus]|uniref:hypothetical protein n=1 Tax=Pontibacter russatus TaxID=2694929 RepID=UPI0013795B26|nr:hypothetical protein [Pontibacter russatus]
MHEPMAQARVYMEPKAQTLESALQEEEGYIGQCFRLTCVQGQPVRVENLAQLHTSRDVPPPRASTYGLWPAPWTWCSAVSFGSS